VSDDAASAEGAEDAGPAPDPGESGGSEGRDEEDGSRGPLDVFLFAPVGVLMTVAEDLPGLIAKGRRRVEQEINNARVVGGYVVQMGQKDVAQRVGQLFGQDAPEAPATTADVAAPTPAPASPAAPPPPPPPRPVGDPADDAVVEQALAGYDTFSASQVVRRLESLEPAQLRAVHRYEASHRNRRTILNRTHQLLESEPPAGPSGADGTNGSTP
jgi:hypothetical protein